ncbi:MAG: DcaP family trimeric outer membrane transporter [Candidatus Paracaedibacteraceae bacterium]|nr:DcaP family trimeric outer membrane transporter [Candidatus Paracaedibacteraceae bacterium]
MRFQLFLKLPLLLGVAATTAVYAGAPVPVAKVVTAPAPTTIAAPVSGPVDTAILLKQIEDLKKKVSHIDYKQRKAEEKLESTTQIEDAKIGILQASQISPFPEGYIPLSGTNSAVSFAGSRIKIDAAYYPGNVTDRTNNMFNDGTAVPIKGADPVAGKSGNSAFTAQFSRFSVGSLTQTKYGDVKAYIETDFNGAQSNIASTSYGLRMRQAKIEMGSLLVGQTITNFHDSDEGPASLDNNGFTAAPRRVQLRWTQKMGCGLTFSASAERPNHEYAFQDGKTYGNEVAGKSTIPDLTARLRLDGKLGFVSLRGLVRRLEVNVQQGDTIGGNVAVPVTATSAYNNKQTGWGLGSSFKLLTAEKSNFFGQANIGEGIGQFLLAEVLPAAYLQLPTSAQTATTTARFSPRFDTVAGVSGILGYEHWWTDAFRTTVSGAYGKLKYSPYAPVMSGATRLTTLLKKALINAVYSPVKNIDVGIELLYTTRETLTGTDQSGAPTVKNGMGKGTQIMTSFIYKF